MTRRASASRSFIQRSAGPQRFSRLRVRHIALLLALLLFVAQDSVGQAQPGIPPFSTIQAQQYDSVNIANLNILVVLPLRNKSAGIPVSMSLTGNSNLYFSVSGTITLLMGGFALNGGLTSPPLGPNASTLWNAVKSTCPNGTSTYIYKDWYYRDSVGGIHYFPPTEQVDNHGCIVCFRQACMT